MFKLLSKYFKAVNNFWTEAKPEKLGWVILAILGITILTVLVFGSIIGLVLAVYWLLWSVFCYIMPFWFPNFALPSYWVFAGTVFLLAWVRNAIRGNRKDASKD